MSHDAPATWMTYAEGVPSALRVRRIRLTVTRGPDQDRVLEVSREVIRIGARAGNDLQLSDPRVSGLHCELRLEPRGYRLRDLGSKNGTFLGGHRVLDAFL